MVKALRYYSDGPGIDSRWCHLEFFPWLFTTPWGRLSLWKWVPGISPGVKMAGGFGWRTTTLVVRKIKKIGGLNLLGTPWATSACCGMTFNFTITTVYTWMKQVNYHRFLTHQVHEPWEGTPSQWPSKHLANVTDYEYPPNKPVVEKAWQLFTWFLCYAKLLAHSFTEIVSAVLIITESVLII